MSIVEFLLARIAEDEEAVRDARLDNDDDATAEWWMPGCWTRNRALAECAAKRAIIERHAPAGPRWVGFPRADRQEWYCTHDQHAYPCPDARILAAVYADHPDYDPSWAPVPA